MKVRVFIESELASSDCNYDFRDVEFLESGILLDQVRNQIKSLSKMHDDHAAIMSEMEG